MENFGVSYKNTLNITTLGSVFMAALLLPLSTTFSNIALGVLLGTTVISFFKLGVDTSFFRQKDYYLLSPLVFFIIILVGILYSPMNYEAFKETKRMLFMFALPMVVLRKDLKFRKMFLWAASGLVIGSLCSAVFLLVLNGYKIVPSGFTWYSIFNYYHTSFNFTQALNLHPIYLGSYYLMALVFIFNEPVYSKKWLTAFSSLILYSAIIFLNSRIIYGITALVSILFLFKNFSWKLVVPLLICLIVGSFFLLPKLNGTYLVDKLVSGTQWELSENVGTYNTDKKYKADSRFSRWKVAWELVEENPLFGTGTGTERMKLGEKFKEYHMKVSFESRYNAHNQFLGFTIRFGVFGLALMLIYFIGNFYNAIYFRDLTFLCFLLLITGVSLVENYLDRNMGINFVAFFGTLFYLQYYRKGAEQ